MPNPVLIFAIFFLPLVQSSCTSEPRCRCIQKNSYADCTGLGLFYLPTFSNSVKVVDLSWNRISVLRNGHFPKGMKYLNISNNPFRSVSRNVFSKLSHLQSLNMRNISMDINDLPQDLFQGLHNMKYLDIKQNSKLKEHYPDNLLSVLLNLKRYSSTGCNMALDDL